MMDDRQTSSPSHLYSPSLQVKLYQALIFSIPILFSVIIFLLFYLFYLKKRTAAVSSPQEILPRTSNQAISSVPSIILKGTNFKHQLLTILFDEDLRTKDSQCCVCLGEFEVKEELHQLPLCKHVFHVDCICHWLQSNATCPLCRCLVSTLSSTTKNSYSEHPPVPLGLGPSLIGHDNGTQDQNSQTVSMFLQPDIGNSSVIVDIRNCSTSTQQYTVHIEGSSSSNASASLCLDYDIARSYPES